LERSELESDILPPTPQPCSKRLAQLQKHWLTTSKLIRFGSLYTLETIEGDHVRRFVCG